MENCVCSDIIVGKEYVFTISNVLCYKLTYTLLMVDISDVIMCQDMWNDKSIQYRTIFPVFLNKQFI